MTAWYRQNRDLVTLVLIHALLFSLFILSIFGSYWFEQRTGYSRTYTIDICTEAP